MADVLAREECGGRRPLSVLSRDATDRASVHMIISVPGSLELFVLSLGISYLFFGLSVAAAPRLALACMGFFASLMLLFSVLELIADFQHERRGVSAFLVHLLLIALCVLPAVLIANRYAGWF
jgi:hypothetical protein